MRIVTGEQMRNIEKIAIEDYGIPSILLMENASVGFCLLLINNNNLHTYKNIGVFCGRGNNGGDGFAIARYLHTHGYNVSCIIGFDEKDAKKLLSNDSYSNYTLVKSVDVPIVDYKCITEKYDFIIDAILGTGIKGAPKTSEAEMISIINKSNAYVVSVDIPSGANASNGKIYSECVCASSTIAIGQIKTGHYLYPAKNYVGHLGLVHISIPKNIINTLENGFYALNDKIFSYLPNRSDNSHKGDFGKVLAFVGSDNMSGAAILSVSAAFKSGVGMVTVASSEKVLQNILLSIPEAMTLPLYEQACEDNLFSALKKNDVMLIGCGIGLNESAKKLTQKLVTNCKKPMIIDADGINNLSENINVLYEKKAPIILTPHTMEFSRMTGLSPEYIEQNRLEEAIKFSKKYDVVLVLKGADTIIASPDNGTYISTYSNSGLATAGSGDVLAGITAGLLAQGAPTHIAAAAAVYVHSLAGMHASNNLGKRSMSASDIIKSLPEVLKII